MCFSDSKNVDRMCGYSIIDARSLVSYRLYRFTAPKEIGPGLNEISPQSNSRVARP